MGLLQKMDIVFCNILFVHFKSSTITWLECLTTLHLHYQSLNTIKASWVLLVFTYPLNHCDRCMTRFLPLINLWEQSERPVNFTIGLREREREINKENGVVEVFMNEELGNMEILGYSRMKHSLKVNYSAIKSASSLAFSYLICCWFFASYVT